MESLHDYALGAILGSRIVAISRAVYGDALERASLALYRGGVRAFEAAIVQGEPIETSLACIRLLKKSLPADAAVGAGTVMDTEQLRAAFEAGASFAISPNTNAEVIALTRKLGMASIPGALTPTEIAAAYDSGADIVKVFPAGTMGIEYFKQVRAPLAHIPMAAVGGLNYENVRAFAEAGAVAFGISGSLYSKAFIEAGDYEAVRAAAEKYYKVLS